MNAQETNLHMLEVVAGALKELTTEVVFVGGATVVLYLPPAATAAVHEIRPTEDVDCVIEVASRLEYSKLEARVRELGFKHVPEGPICRWKISQVIVDLSFAKTHLH